MARFEPPQHQSRTSLIQRMVEPASMVPARDYHQVKLLSYLLIIFIPLSGVAFGLTLLDQVQSARPETTPLLYLILSAVLLLVMAYALGRTKYYKSASSLVVGIITGAVLISAGIQADPTDLNFLTIGILFSGLFLSWRGTVFWLTVIGTGMFLLTLSVPVLTPEVIVERLFFILTIGAIAMLYSAIQQRNLTLIEKRSSVLATSEQALSEARDKLELRIQERTSELEDANIQLQVLVDALEQQNLDLALLTKMGDQLQACNTIEEAGKAIGYMIPQLFPKNSGILLRYNSSRNALENFVTWGNFPIEYDQQKFESEKCWGFRRGRPHREVELCGASLCQFLPKPDHLLCVPMMAQGETLGILHLRTEKSNEILSETAVINEQLAISTAEYISLAISNLNLRETLRHQSIRDPLTGLFNRRYMEETLERELQRSERTEKKLGVIMLDLDHYKNFNDIFGHDAGDTVLRELGVLLRDHLRASDIACRYGGEEFLLILPEASQDVTQERAETLRSKIKQLSIQHRGQSLGSLSASLGVAIFPDHGTTSDALLRAADQALYQAKRAGRDQVVLAENY